MDDSDNKKIIILSRDCTALLVPSGARIMLHKDTEVTITQSLGNSYTVAVYGNLARIDGKDGDALGKTPIDSLVGLPPDSTLEEKVWHQLRSVYDPEIPVNIVDLGLVYGCEIISEYEKNADRSQVLMKAFCADTTRVANLPDDPPILFTVKITMTLTAPGCGMGPVIAHDAKQKVLAIPGVKNADIDIVFDPPWDQSKMSDMAKLELGML